MTERIRERMDVDGPIFARGGLFSRGIPLMPGVGSLLPMLGGGIVIYVDNSQGTASDTTNDGESREYPLATLDKAFDKVRANKNDMVIVGAKHAETITTAGAITCDKAGVVVVFEGMGDDRGTITLGTSTAASIVISAASTWFLNAIIVCNIDGATNPIHVQAASCVVGVEFRDTSDTVEAARAVLTTAAADKLVLNLVYRGRTGGDACVNAVRLVGADGARIWVDFYGKASTSVVEFHTTVCTNANVEGYAYVSGTTDGSKLVVDTVSGSTWFAEIADGAAGSVFSGGSGGALASDDVSAVSTKIGTPVNTGGTATLAAILGDPANVALAARLITIRDALFDATGIASFPAGAAAANGVSLAEVLRYLQENVINGAGTVLPAGDSLFGILAGASGITTWPAAAAPANGVSLAEAVRYIVETLFGTLVNTGGTATVGGILGDPANVSFASRLTTIRDALFDATGIATWPAAAAPANGVSLAEAIRYIVETLFGTLVNTGGTATAGGILGDVANVSIASRLITLRDALFDATGIATFPAAAVAGNGVSLAEVLRYVQENGVGAQGDAAVQAGGAASAQAYLKGILDVLSGTTGISTFPAAAAPANGVSMAEVEREIYDQAEKSVSNTTAALVNGTTIFTITGGPIEILSLTARCVTGNDGTASTLQWSADPTDGAAATFSGASASLANALAGAMVVLQGNTLATAPIVNTTGVGLGQTVTNGIVVGAGIITSTVGVGSTTGTWQHHMRYRPLARGVTVS